MESWERSKSKVQSQGEQNQGPALWVLIKAKGMADGTHFSFLLPITGLLLGSSTPYTDPKHRE